MCSYVYTCVSMEARGQYQGLLLLSSLFSEAESLIDPGASRPIKTTGQDAPWVLISTSPAGGLQQCATKPSVLHKT